MNEKKLEVVTREKLALSMSETAQALGICLPAAYELARTPGFPAVRVSERRLIVPVDALRRWLNERAEESAG